MPEDKNSAPAPTPTNSGGSNSSNDTLMGVLAYLGVLCLIPLLGAKDDAFAQYHAKQGVNLLLLEVVIVAAQWVIGLGGLFIGLGFIFFLFPLLWLGILVLSIIGIVNVVNHKTEPLPLIGGIKLIK
ncbi:DUF4870 domain-containing protein [Candidatus Saccharibacteria bacterium]|nr:DUF4870 domain-containing protein [Candidatus Saccharibacteria bacterium]